MSKTWRMWPMRRFLRCWRLIPFDICVKSLCDVWQGVCVCFDTFDTFQKVTFFDIGMFSINLDLPNSVCKFWCFWPIVSLCVIILSDTLVSISKTLMYNEKIGSWCSKIEILGWRRESELIFDAISILWFSTTLNSNSFIFSHSSRSNESKKIQNPRIKSVSTTSKGHFPHTDKSWPVDCIFDAISQSNLLSMPINKTTKMGKKKERNRILNTLYFKSIVKINSITDVCSIAVNARFRVK